MADAYISFYGLFLNLWLIFFISYFMINNLSWNDEITVTEMLLESFLLTCFLLIVGLVALGLATGLS